MTTIKSNTAINSMLHILHTHYAITSLTLAFMFVFEVDIIARVTFGTVVTILWKFYHAALTTIAMVIWFSISSHATDHLAFITDVVTENSSTIDTI